VEEHIMGYKISNKSEMDYFLATIAEASRHVRSLLFMLLFSSVYVVVASYSGDWQSETLVLPIVDAEISRRWFFIISPVFILFNYVYMHLFLKDLMYRFYLYRQLPLETTFIHKRYLYFPWILPSSEADIDPKTRTFRGRFFYFCLDIVFWWSGPLVLLAILAAYIFQKDVAALVPYICFCLSILHYVLNSRFEKSRFKKFMMIYLAFFLLFITLTAVPQILGIFGIGSIESETFKLLMSFFIDGYLIIFFSCFAIPKTLQSVKNKYYRILLMGLYLIAIVNFAYHFIMLNSGGFDGA